MTLYLQLVKYTADGAKGHLDAGFQSRVDAGTRAVESLGGTLKGYWFVEGGDWHAAQLVEVPEQSERMVRGGFQLFASGAIDQVRLMRLVEPADVDAAGAIDYRPPGE